MFSNLVDCFRRTAAWRFSFLAAVAFSAGTGGAFLGAYFFVAHLIQERSDMWLRGESKVLAEVSETAPAGAIHQTIVEEVAELVRYEVSPDSGGPPASRIPVFFLILPDAGPPALWVGPGSAEEAAAALEAGGYRPDEPFSLHLPGWKSPYRVIGRRLPDNQVAFLGFFDQIAADALYEVKRTFSWLWFGTLAFGSGVSWFGARGILRRVEQITETARRIGSDNLHFRVQVDAAQDDEISRLVATFNDMLHRIEAAVGQIRSVTDSLAHDLRSPLTSIRGNLELALKGGDPDKLRDSAAEAMEQLDRHLQCIESVLDVAESEAGALRLDRTPVDLQQLVREMVEFFRPAFEDQGLTLDVAGSSPPISPALDRKMLQRALGNLLENALQHLPAGCRVTVLLESDSDSVNLMVADDGPGFPEDIRDQAFERFVKGPDSSGYGLGLALVRATARSHGGTARILANREGGSLVQMRLPLRGA